MRNPYAARDPRDSGTHWWLLVVVVALATLVVVVSLGKNPRQSSGPNFAPVVSVDVGRMPLSR